MCTICLNLSMHAQHIQCMLTDLLLQWMSFSSITCSTVPAGLFFPFIFTYPVH